MNDIRLTPIQQKLYDRLKGSGDVSIDDLFEIVSPPDPTYDQNHLRQQRLGPYLTRINRRLREHGLAVKPGQLKRTYRLYVL